MDKPVKHFQKYSHEERADHAASHRLGYRQRTSPGTSFWTHPTVPGIAFPTRKAAMRAAERLISAMHEIATNHDASESTALAQRVMEEMRKAA